MKKTLLILLPFLGVTLALAGEDKTQSAAAVVNRVTKGGRGNEEAQAAWKILAKLPPEALPELLASFQNDNPLGQNWLRTAVNTVVENARKSGQSLPQAALQKFLDNKANLPEARALAFEILLQIDAKTKERVPSFLNDPGAELRRLGVAYWQEKSLEAKKANKKEEAVAGLKKCFQAASDQDQVDALAKELKSLGENVDLPGHYGFIQSWHLTGAFDSTGGKGYGTVYPPEGKVDLAATYKGKGGEQFGWKEFPTTHDHGQMDLNKLIGKKKDCLAYAYAKIITAQAGQVYLRAGCITALKIWVNGAPAYAREEYHHGMSIDQHITPITLRKGANTILLKVCQNNQTDSWAQKWEFMVRLTDSAGSRIAFTPAEKTGGE